MLSARHQTAEQQLAAVKLQYMYSSRLTSVMTHFMQLSDGKKSHAVLAMIRAAISRPGTPCLQEGDLCVVQGVGCATTFLQQLKRV
mmetsp:Transcript_16430/g.28161  ORF Transcript_16430/g.28161 Transcript_16430/m.28161 type:complete len:86 (+) Transcript_16430:905-1162(+)